MGEKTTARKAGLNFCRLCLEIIRDNRALWLCPAVWIAYLVVQTVAFSCIVFEIQQANLHRLPLIVCYLSVALVFYLGAFIALQVCNLALLSSAKTYFEGQKPSWSKGLRAGLPHLSSALVASFGLGFLSFLETFTRTKHLGINLIAGALGESLKPLRFLIIPIMVFENEGPLAAFKRAKSYPNKTHRLTVALGGAMGLNILVGYAVLSIFVSFGVTYALLCLTDSAAPMAIGFALAVTAYVGASFARAVLSQVFLAALYIDPSEGKGKLLVDQATNIAKIVHDSKVNRAKSLF